MLDDLWQIHEVETAQPHLRDNLTIVRPDATVDSGLILVFDIQDLWEASYSREKF